MVRGKRNVRWAGKGEEGDRHFALWSHEQVCNLRRLTFCACHRLLCSATNMALCLSPHTLHCSVCVCVCVCMCVCMSVCVCVRKRDRACIYAYTESERRGMEADSDNFAHLIVCFVLRFNSPGLGVCKQQLKDSCILGLHPPNFIITCVCVCVCVCHVYIPGEGPVPI